MIFYKIKMTELFCKKKKKPKKISNLLNLLIFECEYIHPGWVLCKAIKLKISIDLIET